MFGSLPYNKKNVVCVEEWMDVWQAKHTSSSIPSDFPVAISFFLLLTRVLSLPFQCCVSISIIHQIISGVARIPVYTTYFITSSVPGRLAVFIRSLYLSLYNSFQPYHFAIFIIFIIQLCVLSFQFHFSLITFLFLQLLSCSNFIYLFIMISQSFRVKRLEIFFYISFIFISHQQYLPFLFNLFRLFVHNNCVPINRVFISSLSFLSSFLGIFLFSLLTVAIINKAHCRQNVSCYEITAYHCYVSHIKHNQKKL